MCGHVALKEIEPVFPGGFPSVGVERQNAFLQLRAAASWLLDVDAIAHDDRRRAAAAGHAPEEILAVQFPGADQPLFDGDAVAIGAAQLGPVAGPHLARALSGKRHAQSGDDRRDQASSFQHAHPRQSSAFARFASYGATSHISIRRTG
jgi:hypothetical protein